MLKTKCKNCGRVIVADDKNRSTQVCPHCQVAFSESGTKKWEKDRDISDLGTPAISTALLICAIVVALVGTYISFALGETATFYQDFNFFAFFFGEGITAVLTIMLLAWKSMIDYLSQIRQEATQIREFKELDASQYIDKNDFFEENEVR